MEIQSDFLSLIRVKIARAAAGGSRYLDIAAIWIDTSTMLRRFLAILLAVLWIVLSGVDLVEDLDLASTARVQNAKTATAPSPGQAIKIANDTFENATGTVVLQIGPMSRPDSDSVAYRLHNQASRVPGSHLHLYTLHSAFLI